jgi:multidrug resistance efflux pump
MLNFLKRRIKSEKGAMDKILVTLLLVIVGIGAVVGLSTWMSGQSDAMTADANTTIQGQLAH